MKKLLYIFISLVTILIPVFVILYTNFNIYGIIIGTVIFGLGMYAVISILESI